MVFCIKKFLSYFCLVYSTNEGDLHLDYSSLDLPENKNDILGVMDRMHEIYQQEFQSVLEKVSDIPEFHVNFPFYTNATLSRCINLFGTGNYYHFMLVCTLVREFIFTSFDSEKCYTFAGIGLQCLSIMYDRCSGRPLNDVDGYQALAIYCRSLNPDLLTEEYDPEKPWPLAARYEISFLIRSLRDVDDVNYQLADYEQQKINDFLNSIPMQDTDGEVMEASSNGLFESENSSNDDTSEEDGSGTLESKECSDTEEVCPICRRRCLELVEKFLDSIRI